jgi:hypothetical protein
MLTAVMTFLCRLQAAMLIAMLAFASCRADEVLLVVGAAGEESYGKHFAEMAESWTSASGAHQVRRLSKLEELREQLTSADKREGLLWLVLIGHGTSDARTSHFNLEGPDLAVEELTSLLKPLKREVVLIDTTSASGAFIKAISGAKRTVVTATKGADEVYYTRFGRFFATAISGLDQADLDRDEQVSVLEAFLYASRETAGFYEKESRIATEHALLDDNGDGQGSRADAFKGLVTAEARGRARQTTPSHSPWRGSPSLAGSAQEPRRARGSCPCRNGQTQHAKCG